MHLREIRTKAGLVAAMAVVGVGAAIAPASADSANVDGWSDHCNYSGVYGCLYYSPNGAGGIFGSNKYYYDLSNHTFSDGHTVINDAASIGNYTVNCGSTTWQGKHASGDYNWVHAGRGGNLNSSLRNNEESFDPAASCT
ncbi:hypothetical protein [Streptomyces achromogenes]|uniref:hypothetical protein n=1 Tax=Streptomyces achromogenes TaxID=67255 RepID=UPI003687025B